MKVVAETLQSNFAGGKSYNVLIEEVQSMRDEMKSSFNEVQKQVVRLVNGAVERVQAKAEERAEAMLKRMVEALRARTKGKTGEKGPINGNDTSGGHPVLSAQSPTTSDTPQRTWAAVAQTAMQQKT